MNVRQAMQDYIVDNILFGEGERLQTDVPLYQNGIVDSLGVLEIITFMEQKFGIEIADDEVIPANFETLRKMCEFVERKIDERSHHVSDIRKEIVEAQIVDRREAE